MQPHRSAHTMDNDNPGLTASKGLAPVTERVNGEPIIFKGLSATELTVFLVMMLAVWLFMGLLIVWALGHWHWVLMVMLVGWMASIWYGAGLAAKLKRNRPDHFAHHTWIWLCHRMGLKQTALIHHHGYWSLGRSMPDIQSNTSGLWAKVLRWMGGQS